MKKFEKDYKGIIQKIRDTNPVLHNPDEMTESIIRKVNNKQASFKTEKANKIILVLRPVMAAAASLLIGLFVYQHLNTPQSGINKPENNLNVQIIHSEKDYMDLSYNSHEKVMDKIKHCSEKTNQPLNQFDRKCLFSLASEYYKINHLNNQKKKQKLLSWYNK